MVTWVTLRRTHAVSALAIGTTAVAAVVHSASKQTTASLLVAICGAVATTRHAVSACRVTKHRPTPARYRDCSVYQWLDYMVTVPLLAVATGYLQYGDAKCYGTRASAAVGTIVATAAADYQLETVPHWAMIACALFQYALAVGPDVSDPVPVAVWWIRAGWLFLILIGPVRSRDIGVRPQSGEVWLPLRATKFIYWEAVACVISCTFRLPVIILLVADPENDEMAGGIIATVAAFVAILVLWALDRNKLQSPVVAADSMSQSLMQFAAEGNPT